MLILVTIFVQLFKMLILATIFVKLFNRGGVLEDTFWSPWPRSLKSSKIALSSARGQHYFWTVKISLENARNLAENLQRPFYWFPQVEIAWNKIFEDLFRLKKIFENFFLRSPEKKFFEDLFIFGEHLRLCHWFLALASKFFCIVGLGLEPCVLDSTSTV